ncbi:16S rRNA (cytidine(1402)-2'-O)-methyltransferase [Patescibacteria group bacterium]|nr:16S rRNA (cytidine(1402)-2'-O)-methyltransferase [Patescibacteria group bacterium]
MPLNNTGTLFVVATPIGNLADLSSRALETLKTVDYIACEDTRVTSKLLSSYNIKKSLLTYFQHSRLSQVKKLISLLEEGKNIALVTDAGTPGLADPGGRLIADILDKDIKVIPIPGPSALATALSISGMPVDEFHFFGFLPHKKGRQTKLYEVIDSLVTSVLYESVHRIEKLLKQLTEYGIGRREVVVCRELTKKFESVYRGNSEQVLRQLQADQIKGEFVVIIEKNGKKK